VKKVFKTQSNTYNINHVSIPFQTNKWFNFLISTNNTCLNRFLTTIISLQARVSILEVNFVKDHFVKRTSFAMKVKS